MSHCVISAVIDADDPVHTHWTPCPNNGQPASPGALHAAGVGTSREEAVASWERKTHRQRPLVLHVGSLADQPDHNIESGDGCWCGPEFLPAVEVDRG